MICLEEAALVVKCLILQLINLCRFLKHDQVESLRQRCEVQGMELLKSTKKAQEAVAMVKEESANSKAS